MSEELKTIIGEAIGEASMCWVGGTGHLEFDSQHAALVADRLYEQVVATRKKPTYRKQRQSERPDRAVDQGTALYMITVDEGWRSWILCTDMYEWAADQLIHILEEVEATWPRPE